MNYKNLLVYAVSITSLHSAELPWKCTLVDAPEYEISTVLIRDSQFLQQPKAMEPCFKKANTQNSDQSIIDLSSFKDLTKEIINELATAAQTAESCKATLEKYSFPTESLDPDTSKKLTMWAQFSLANLLSAAHTLKLTTQIADEGTIPVPLIDILCEKLATRLLKDKETFPDALTILEENKTFNKAQLINALINKYDYTKFDEIIDFQMKEGEPIEFDYKSAIISPQGDKLAILVDGPEGLVRATLLSNFDITKEGIKRTGDKGLAHSTDLFTHRVMISPDSRLLMSQFHNGYIVVQTMQGEQKLQCNVNHPFDSYYNQIPTFLTFSADSSKIASGYNDYLQVWTISNGIQIHKNSFYGNKIRSLALNQDGSAYAVALQKEESDPIIQVHTARSTGACTWKSTLFKQVYAIAFGKNIFRVVGVPKDSPSEIIGVYQGNTESEGMLREFLSTAESEKKFLLKFPLSHSRITPENLNLCRVRFDACGQTLYIIPLMHSIITPTAYNVETGLSASMIGLQEGGISQDWQKLLTVNLVDGIKRIKLYTRGHALFDFLVARDRAKKGLSMDGELPTLDKMRLSKIIDFLRTNQLPEILY